MRTILSTLVAGVLLAGPMASALPAKTIKSGSERNSTGGQITRTISVPVTTGFGVYRPYSIPRYKAEIGMREAAVASDFSNIAVADATLPWNSYFTNGELAKLRTNGFVARPEAIGSFGQAYSVELGPHPMGSFITVDAVLHGLRVAIDEASRDMERNYASATLRSELADLSDAISTQLAAERSSVLTGSLERLLAYVETAESLLNSSASVDPKVRSQVSDELRKIRAAAGSDRSSVLPGLTINYARLAPAGYYANDQKLADYYRTRAWLSQAGFSLRTSSGAPDLESVRMASLLARVIGTLSASGDFRQTHANLNEPIAFFTGGGERISSWDVLTSALRGYYGRMVEADASFLADNGTLTGFVDYLEEQLPATARTQAGAATFRLIEWEPEHDRAMLDRIWQDTRVSAGSYGLIAMSAIGSNRAAELRQTAAGTSRALKSALTAMPVEGWVQDLDRAVLYTVQALALDKEREAGYPRFMRGAAWRDREILSSLGAWAAFQHEPQVMQMRAVAKAAAASSGREIVAHTYVEPNPEAWARVASLAAYIRNGLTEGRGGKLIRRGVEAKLEDIENISAKLMQIAALELNGKELAGDHVDLLRSMPERIAAYELFTDKSLRQDGYPVTTGGARVGDVHVATGHPLAIYVIVPQSDGELVLTRGAIYSYHEVSGSLDDWSRRMMAGGGAAAEPGWMSSFLSSDRAFAQDARKFQGVNATIPVVATAYTPSQQEHRPALSKAVLSLESDVLSRNAEELWFTVRAPGLEGSELMVSVANMNGQEVQRIQIGRIKNGERLDVVRIGELAKGQYFIRVEDLGGRMVASSRFLVVR